MTKTRMIATVTFATLVMLSGNLKAQTTVQANTGSAIGMATQAVAPGRNSPNAQMVQGQIETRVQPDALLVVPPAGPKLGFSGQIVPGVGMKVLQVNYGGPAHKAGLEHGDIIMSANGRQIRNRFDLSQALAHAASHTGGQVNLLVKNIRGTSCHGNQYVNVTAHLFGRPIHGVTPLPMPVTQN